MKKLSAFIIFCMLLVSCDFLIDDSLLEGDKGNLSLIIRDDGVSDRALTPEGFSMDIYSYDIRGTNNLLFESFTENGYMGTNYTKSNLSVGSWQITVDARNDRGTLIGSGMTTVNVTKNFTATSDVNIKPLVGQGTLDLYVEWTMGSLSSPNVIASLTDSDGFTSAIYFNYYENTASYHDEVDTGYYDLEMDLWDGDSIVWNYSDTVRIINSQLTEGSFVYGSDKGLIDLTIDSNMENPLDITFTGEQTSIGQGTDMTIYADVSEIPDSYQWYLNGEELYGETDYYITIGSGLDLGNHRLSLVVQKGSILSSEGFNFVINQVISLDVEVYSGSYGSEVTWQIVDGNGNEVASSEYYSSGNYYYPELILAPGEYTIYGQDSYGDGWNGGYVTISNNGVVILDQFTFSYGSSAETNFTVLNTNIDIIGEWTLYFDWAPTDSYYSTSLSLNADNTFDTAGSYSGVWSINEDQLVLTFSNGTEYTGTVQNSGYASGTMVDYEGVNGLWYADR